MTHPFQLISSDHYVVSFFPSCISLSYSKPKPKYVFNFSKADYDSICSFLLDVDFSVCLQSSNIEFIWAMISSFLHHAMYLYIPKTSIRSRPKWFDSSIRHQINCLKTLRRKHKSHPSPSKSSKINLLEQQLHLRISSAKSEFESKLLLALHSNGMSKVFKYNRNVTGQNNILTLFTSVTSLLNLI